jgi:uncharacterized RDD family membrane protein YckC
MLPENRAFLIQGDDGQEYGPVDLTELREWVQENRAGIGTSVRLDEPNSTWRPWQSYPELVALLAEIQGTDPTSAPIGTVIAPLGRRILASMLDFILSSFLASPILCVVMTIYLPDWEVLFTQMLLQPQSPPPPQIVHYVVMGNAIVYLILALYMAGFHAAHGQTPGKAIMRIRVVNQNGVKPNFFKALVRGIGFVVSFYLYGIPFFYAFFNPQRRTAHDFMAGTYVVNA